jgi:hypothetical protein
MAIFMCDPETLHQERTARGTVLAMWLALHVIVTETVP